MKRCWWLPMVMVVAACSGEPDLGDLPEQEALDVCQKTIAAQDGVSRVLASEASKSHRYWEVSGTHRTGTFHCVVNAVNGKVVISSWGSG